MKEQQRDFTSEFQLNFTTRMLDIKGTKCVEFS